MLKKSLLVCGVLFATYVHANDSTGYVAAGGVQYIKNDKIAMHSEELYVSKDLIKVDYQFKNLSNQDITETILFPLPKVLANGYDYDFADVTDLPNSFKIWANGRAVKPTIHARVHMLPIGVNVEDTDKAVDVTQIFKACGVDDKELWYPWVQTTTFNAIAKKLWNCNHPALNTMIDKSTPLSKDEGLSSRIAWDTELIYSWQQTFKAGAITHVKHSYQPLVGSSVHFGEAEYDGYCVADDIKRTLARRQAYRPIPPKFVSYILTTGANWAKPIANFKLTIKRDRDELVSFCWAGQAQVVKQGNGVFTITEKNFTPTKDLDVVFLKVR